MRGWQLNPEEAFRRDNRRYSSEEWRSWFHDPRTVEVTKALHRKFLDKVNKFPQSSDDALIAQAQAAAVKECILIFTEVAAKATGEDVIPER